MNKEQKEVQQTLLDKEKEILKKLEKNYKDAISEIEKRIAILKGRNDANLTNVVYQIEYQQALKAQISAILEQLQTKNFDSLSEFLTDAYNTGYLGCMYDLNKQGIPLIVPISQDAVVKAIQHETKLSESLYKTLGKDTKELLKQIVHEISRGISNGSSNYEMARNIQWYSDIPKNRAMTIARTESHRIQCKATADAQYIAKENGADVVKQWDSALDGSTRDTHRKLDGQIRELDEPFEVDGMTAMQPGGFGDPAEDCNCRCALLQRARWALGQEELDTLKERAAYFGLDKTKDFEDFKSKYMKATKK